MKTAKSGGQELRLGDETLKARTPNHAEDAALRPIQKHISNWERDLVEQRSAARRAQENTKEVRTGITMLTAVAGIGLLLIGQPLLAVAVLGGGVLISPGLHDGPRNDRDR